MDRVDVVNEHLRGRGVYLEIGVNAGSAFWRVDADTRIGVDPAFIGRKLNGLAAATPWKLRLGMRRGVILFAETSDRFFDVHSRRFGRIDCVLVDGLHTADQAYRDVVNALNWLADDGVIVMHDCNPTSETLAMPTREEASLRPDYTGAWNGDVWRAVLRLRTRTDLEVRVLDCDHGVGIVSRGTPSVPLSMADSEIAAMTYAQLAGDRQRLLNLQQV